MLGSPPRAWGQWRARRQGARRGRFTPTGVGTMLMRTPILLSTSVHPHGRGDNDLAALRRLENDRFTPTGVGTMPSASASSTFAAVHPHGRGDNDVQFVLHNLGVGSPPRAWGQSRRACEPPTAARFTPTGVGTIWPRRLRAPLSAVHPHGRGDNLGARMLGRIVNGSPPRAWGQCVVSADPPLRYRFTPTVVGTMHCGQCGQCGHRGSPPRAWGQCGLG